ncbi:MAG: Na+/H+ antiporter NhaC [Deltaproteobacteria bacterium]|nr:Na+/H+ antiporter NhaC [Deltaproteobacteria bacterium]
MNQPRNESQRPTPSLTLALLPVGVLVGTLYLTVVYLRAFQLTTHVALVIGTLVAGAVALRLGQKWEEIETSMIEGITLSLRALLILLSIGMLIGTWIQGGIVPAMIYYGLTLISPGLFLAASALICALVSVATGSSWSTAATVGIALIGIGEGMGIDRAQVAGAVISGAYFGDKMSPLSDTTNLAPAMAGAKLFDHIRHMVYTTGPSMLIALVAYGFMGRSHSGSVDTSQVDAIREAISGSYTISPWLLLPPLGVIALVVLRLPALPAVVGGWLLGALVAFYTQARPLGAVLKASYSGVKSKTGHALVDDLLSRGGLSSMFSTMALILVALTFGGVMEGAGMLDTLARAVLGLAHGDGGLVLATVASSIGMNILASDQYLAVVVPGRMYCHAYAERGLAPKNLSRALEDGGTLTSALIPWNTCGAFMIATLGVQPWSYVPYALLNLINPLISIVYGYTGITLTRLDEEEKHDGAATEREEKDA